MLRNKSLLESVEYPNKVAAISIKKYGVLWGMPTGEDVERRHQLDK